jgi:hypothetical protein
MAGSIKTTANVLMSAPRAISEHIELIISIFEYSETPNVAAKSPNALATIDGTELVNAIFADSYLFNPSERSFAYLFVISIA